MLKCTCNKNARGSGVDARATCIHVRFRWLCKEKKPDFYSLFLRQLRFRLNLLCFLIGGHFEVTKEKRPLDIKKVFTRWSAKLSLYFEFFSQTRKWNQLIRKQWTFVIPGRLQFTQRPGGPSDIAFWRYSGLKRLQLTILTIPYTRVLNPNFLRCIHFKPELRQTVCLLTSISIFISTFLTVN